MESTASAPQRRSCLNYFLCDSGAQPGSRDGNSSPAACRSRRSQVSHSPTLHCDFRQSNSQIASASGTSSTICRRSHPHAARTRFIPPPIPASPRWHSSTDAVGLRSPLASHRPALSDPTRTKVGPLDGHGGVGPPDGQALSLERCAPWQFMPGRLGRPPGCGR